MPQALQITGQTDKHYPHLIHSKTEKSDRVDGKPSLKKFSMMILLVSAITFCVMKSYQVLTQLQLHMQYTCHTVDCVVSPSKSKVFLSLVQETLQTLKHSIKSPVQGEVQFLIVAQLPTISICSRLPGTNRG